MAVAQRPDAAVGAGRDHAEPRLGVALEAVEQAQQQARARRAQRMAEGDRAPARVKLVRLVQARPAVAVQAPDPANYVPVIFAIAIVSLVVALIAARAKKPPAKK